MAVPLGELSLQVGGLVRGGRAGVHERAGLGRSVRVCEADVPLLVLLLLRRGVLFDLALLHHAQGLPQGGAAAPHLARRRHERGAAAQRVSDERIRTVERVTYRALVVAVVGGRGRLLLLLLLTSRRCRRRRR